MSTLVTLLIVLFAVLSMPHMAGLNAQRGAYLTTTSSTTVVRSVDPKIWFLQAKIAPLVAFVNQVGPMIKVANPKHEWAEKDMGVPYAKVVGAVTNVATSVPVTTGAGTSFAAYDLVMNQRTGEQFQVTTDPAADTLTVKRAFGVTAAAAMVDGDVLILLGPAYGENKTSGSAIAISPSMPYNYSQTFRHWAEVSRREAFTERYDIKMPRMIERRKEAMLYHMEAMARAFYLGEPYVDTATDAAHPITVGGGLKYKVTTNVLDCQGALSKNKFDTIVRATTFYGADDKLLFASGSFLQALQEECLTQPYTHLNLSPDSKKFGFNIREYESPFGTIGIVRDRILDQIAQGEAYIIDKGSLRRFGMQDTIIRHNVQAPDQDGFKDEILSDCHVQVANEPKFARIYNI